MSGRDYGGGYGRGYERRDDRQNPNRGYERRDDRQNPNRAYGRDRRERSPDRRASTFTRDDRRGDLTQRYGDAPARQYTGRMAQGENASPLNSPPVGSIQSSESLPTLPTSVTTPDKKGSRFPGNPLKEPRGQSGRRIVVKVNHFAIESLPIVKIFQYDVRMRVPESSQRRGSEKVTAMQQAKVFVQSEHLWGKYFVFDGVSIGWSTEELIEGADQKSTVVDLPGHTQEKPNQVEVAIRKTGKLNIRDLVNYLQSGLAGLAAGNAEVENVFKAFNALFRDDPSKRFITFPKSTAYFSRVESLCKPLPSTGGVLEALRGIYQSISFGFGKLSLNIDTKCSAFYTPGMPLTEVAAAFCGTRDISRVTRSECEAMMTGIYFCVKHLSDQGNAHKKRIQKLSENNALTKVFTVTEAGTGQEYQTNVKDYFSKKYGIRLSYPDLPLLVSQKGMFPMEVCFTAPDERYKEALQGAATADFIKFATSPATIREKQIIDNVRRLAHWNLEKPKQWGLSVSPRMLETPAVILPAPVPLYHHGPERDVSRGSWNLKGKRFVHPQAFRAWGVVYFPGPRGGPSEGEIEAFCKDLDGALAGHGLRTANRAPAMLRANAMGGNVESIVHDICNKTDNTYGAKPNLILFILNEKMPLTVYKACKQVCECLVGIPSQCLLAEKALSPKGRLQYLSNVALKINAKLGGLNWHVEDPLFKGQKVMILGADSTHPSPGELRRESPPPSYGCLVGSMDPNCSFYTAVTVAQATTQELIGTETMGAMFGELVKRFRNKNQYEPERVLFFRDGISDHQVDAFVNTEVLALKNMRAELGIDFKLTVINCIKRHHTRFFPTNSREGDRLGNVMPCTVVHNCQGRNDIYVVSQAALQGTCRPTHYVSIYDENELSIDNFQRVVLQGCFNYQRATRSVSLHSAVYYADQCCERAKLHLREEGGQLVLKDVSQALALTMYWQ